MKGSSARKGAGPPARRVGGCARWRTRLAGLAYLVSFAGAVVVPVMAAAAPDAADALTPAGQKIAQARQAIADKRANFETYADLTLALARRARETSDAAFYDQASEAVQESFRLVPDNFPARKARVWVLLGQHEFAQAREEARALNQRMPDDLMVYAMLVDANIELGNYDEAETAAQWLLDLRPGTVPGLTRAAYLRELFGDLDGASEMMSQAYERTPPNETEDRAWLLTQIAHLQRVGGRLGDAEALLTEGLKLFPGYHYALAEMARVRTAQKRHADAVALLQQHFATAPHPENLYALAEALKRAGKRREARAAFRDFEQRALAESTKADNSNRELIFYYVDHAGRPREGLQLAEKEMAARPNVFTRDAYAWALFANRRAKEARQQLQKALAVGVRDPLLLEHARRMGIVRPSGSDRTGSLSSNGVARPEMGQTP